MYVCHFSLAKHIVVIMCDVFHVIEDMMICAISSPCVTEEEDVGGTIGYHYKHFMLAFGPDTSVRAILVSSTY